MLFYNFSHKVALMI